MRVLESTVGFDLKDYALVLVTLPLPFTLPENRASGVPARADLCAEHVLPDDLRVDEGVPHLLDGSAYYHDCVRNETFIHLSDPLRKGTSPSVADNRPHRAKVIQTPRCGENGRARFATRPVSLLAGPAG